MLRRGRTLIAEKGLAKGYLWDDNGRVCSIGAISCVAREIDQNYNYIGRSYRDVRLMCPLGSAESKARQASLNYLKQAMGFALESDMYIGTWNDSHTDEEVLQAWDKAIALAEVDEDVVEIVDNAEAERLAVLA